MADDNIKVIVRVRPFDKREKERKAQCVVEMRGNETVISGQNGYESASLRTFTFDYSFWSFDGFKTDDNGTHVADPTHPRGFSYVDQNRMCGEVADAILANAWTGFNAALFAYGQTGAGKSYSIVGDAQNKGIVPWLCEKLFEGISMKESEGGSFEVSLNMLEIYSEQVRDLLNGGAELHVREGGERGFHAVNQKTIAVQNYSEIEKRMNAGLQDRTIASTNMNETSSRAHTIIGLKFRQMYLDAHGDPMTRVSVLNLVDLAGSERQKSTAAEGQRLKEGAAINLSLSTLGNVISALVQGASHIPYRDSALTKLLKNALGGNSKTFMIAAISPADINYEESLSTLRYADRAKQIKTAARVNENRTEKIIRELREEILHLQKKLLDRETTIAEMKRMEASSAQDTLDESAMAAMMDEKKEEMESAERFLKGIGIEDRPEEDGEGTDSALRTASSLRDSAFTATSMTSASNFFHCDDPEKITSTPHIWNLNAHPKLNGKIFHFFEKPKTLFGRKGQVEGESSADVEIFDDQNNNDDNDDDRRKNKSVVVAAITSLDEGLFIQASSTSSHVLVNGIRLCAKPSFNGIFLPAKKSDEDVGEDSTPHRLVDKDWICFGPDSFFVVSDPRHSCPNKDTPTMASARRQLQRRHKSAICIIL